MSEPESVWELAEMLYDVEREAVIAAVPRFAQLSEERRNTYFAMAQKVQDQADQLVQTITETDNIVQPDTWVRPFKHG